MTLTHKAQSAIHSSVKTRRYNDEERRQWINGDEGLYRRRRPSGLSPRKFIRAYRAEIDQVINTVRSGAKPAGYLACPHDERCGCYGCAERRKAGSPTKRIFYEPLTVAEIEALVHKEDRV